MKFLSRIHYYIFWPIGFVAAFVLASYTVPAVLNFVEQLGHKGLSYEMAMRVYLFFVYALCVGVCGLWTLRRGMAVHRVVLSFFVFTLFSVLVVFIGDRHHIVMEEWSWIRYPSAAMLYLAGALAFYLGYLVLKKTGSRKELLFLIPGGIALLFAGTDELAQIHEYLGRFIHTSKEISGGNDLITIGYAIAIFIVLVTVARVCMRECAKRSHLLWPTLILGVSAFTVSVLFDTFDIIFKKKIHTLATILASDPFHIFQDQWYLVYHPRIFFNSVEEVLELTAATAFCAAFFITIQSFQSQDRIAKPKVFPRMFLNAIGGVAVAVVIFLFFTSLPSTQGSSVLSQGSGTAQVIGSESDGLYHADDLVFNRNWGVLLANEGGQNVYQFKDGRLRRLPDKGHQLHDMDSITATDSAVFVSDGSAGIIYQFDGKNEWKALWTRKDGLVHPEALVSHDGALYVLDMIKGKAALVRLKKGEKPVIWYPEHVDWRAPEGIKYDEKRKRFLVTDDETGAVFEVDFGKSIHKIASFQNAEELVVAPDGSILVTDNGNATVWRILPDNRVTALLRLKRPYRDLQGITLDSDGNLFLVTSDDVESASFMPSYLFRIADIHL